MHAELAKLDNDLQKYLLLSDLQVRNETLFYADADVGSGDASCRSSIRRPSAKPARSSIIFSARRAGIYLPITARGRLRDLLGNWPQQGRALHRRHRWRAHSWPRRSRRRRHGHSDRQARALHRLRRRAAAILPADHARRRHQQSGSPRRSALSRPAAEPRPRRRTIWPSSRVRRGGAGALIPNAASSGRTSRTSTRFRSSSVIATRSAPTTTTSRARPRWRSPAFSAHCEFPGKSSPSQRFLFLGGGSAATGIAELISQAMALEGMDITEARARNALFDINGLMVTSRNDLADFQKPFAQDHAPVSTFVDAVKALRPTGIIGVSTVPKLFNQQVIEAMAADQRAADHLSLFQSDIALGMHGRGGLSLVAGPRDLCQRQPVPAGRISRARHSCPAKAIMSISSRPWAWRSSPPRPRA